MLTEYLTIKEKTTGRFSIEKSVFLYICLPVQDSDAAEAALAAVRKEYPGATHYCYAYIADCLGNAMRFSDDGEPQGTAGMPMLEVLKTHKLRFTLICAVRWFGGKKLGAGGLTRAYIRAAAEAVNSAEIVTRRLCAVYSAALPYSASEKIIRSLRAGNIPVLKTEYAAGVLIEFAVPVSDEKRVLESFNEAAAQSPAPLKIREEFV